jgi:hypothetical protein
VFRFTYTSLKMPKKGDFSISRIFMILHHKGGGTLGTGTDTHPDQYHLNQFLTRMIAQHEHKFSHFSNIHFVYPQHAHKEPMRACTEHARQELMHELSIRVHRAQSLQNMLCISVRN